MHGRKAHAKVVIFGERCYYVVPKKLRAKLDRPWRLGVYLGSSPDPNEHFFGAWNGDVVRYKSIARVLEKSRWSTGACPTAARDPCGEKPEWC